MCGCEIHRFVKVVGRGRALRRICVGGRNSDNFCCDTFPPFDVALEDCALETGICCDSGVSPRFKLLFELPDERLCNEICVKN